MKNQIVADGPQRLAAGQNAKHLEATRAKYADEWVKANFLKRIWLRWQIRREPPNQKADHQPSPGTLW